MNAQPQPLSFTVTATGILDQLVTDCGFSTAFDPQGGGQGHSFAMFKAIWDTGATGSVISQRVVDACALKPIGMAQTRGVGGVHDTESYLVNIGLPNKVAFYDVTVIRGELSGFDALIGMNIIAAGDFVITNKGGKTVFSFRYPSCECIDFVTQGVRTPWGVRKLQSAGGKKAKHRP